MKLSRLDFRLFYQLPFLSKSGGVIANYSKNNGMKVNTKYTEVNRSEEYRPGESGFGSIGMGAVGSLPRYNLRKQRENSTP